MEKVKYIRGCKKAKEALLKAGASDIKPSCAMPERLYYIGIDGVVRSADESETIFHLLLEHGEEIFPEPCAEPECGLKPFQRVLVRDSDEQKWNVSFFGYYEAEMEYPFICMGDLYGQCIPYEGNEHLLGTTKKPGDGCEG